MQSKDKQDFSGEIAQYNIPLKPEAQRVSATADIYIVRHGMSDYNFDALVTVSKYGDQSDELRNLQKRRDIVDTPLHPIGAMQCEANKDSVHCLNAKYVLVSPMRRAMQTCIGMFKHHPKVKEMRFIVVPLVREILHTVCDVPSCVYELQRNFAKGEDICEGIEFDFGHLKHAGDP